MVPKLTHALYADFLTSASPSTPIVYYVERLRNGRSYATRSVKAAQNGAVIFTLLCSFQKPEPWQPSYQWPMPVVPPPEDCELEEARYTQLAMEEGINPKLKQYYLDFAFVSYSHRAFLVNLCILTTL